MPKPRVVFDQVNVVVSDMDASVAFYRRLGLEIGGDGEPWAHQHRNAETQAGIDFDLDSADFAQKWNENWTGTGSVLGFRVATREDVDEVYNDLTTAGYEGQQPPYDAFWGSRYAIVLDPDRNPVGIMSPRDDAFRSAPPES